ncbi:MAG: ABC transporter permease [Fibrobacteres bacterium]|nr:ABC transporter permease [Fibrobacterota bacterium]
MSRASFVFQEALRGLFFNKFMTFAVIVNIAISLFFASVFLTVFLNLNRVIKQAESRITIEVFLEDSKVDTAAVHREIMATPGIKNVRYVSKEDAYDIFVKEVGSEIMQAVDGNPLPASFKCSIIPDYREPDRLSVIRNGLKGISGVDDVSEIRGWVPLLQKVRKIFAGVSLAAFIILSLAIFFTVFSTIRIAYQSRHEHIRVLALVGAPESAIRIPFIISGAIQGLCGGALSTIVLFISVMAAKHFYAAAHFNLLLVPLLLGLGLSLGVVASFRSIPTEEHL